MQSNQFFAAFVTVLGVAVSAASGGEADSSKVVIDTVVRALDANDAALGVIDAKVHQVIDQPRIAELAERRVKLSSGKVLIKPAVSRRMEQDYSFVIGKEATAYRDFGTDGKVKGWLIHKDGVFTQYNSELEIAWRNVKYPLPDAVANDPREYALNKQTSTIRASLRGAETATAEYVHDRVHGELAHVVVEMSDGGQITFDFLPANNYLPIRAVVFQPGKLRMESEMENAKIEGRDAWFPSRATTVYFQAVKWGEPIQDEWSIKIERTVRAAPITEQAAEAAVNFKLPAGTQVYDSILRRNRIVGDDE